MSENGTFNNDTGENQEIPNVSAVPQLTNELPITTTDSRRQPGSQVSDTRNDHKNRSLLGMVRGGWEVVGHVVRRGPSTSGSIIAANANNGFDAFDENNAPDDDISRDAAKWSRRRDIPLAILAWAGVLFIIAWTAGHIASTITLLVVAALLAYALAPAVSFLERWMPRFLATLLVYLVVLSAISGLMYFIVSAAYSQIGQLSAYIIGFLTPDKNGISPLAKDLKTFNISQSQIDALRTQFTGQIGTVAGGVVPILSGFFNVILDVILVAILSIYLLVFLCFV